MRIFTAFLIIRSVLIEACGERYMGRYFTAIFKEQEGEHGQDLAEYAMLLGLLALVVVVAVIFLGDSFSSVYSMIVSELSEVF
jgi:Flp pilus assembly pilin Flp